MKPSKQDFFNQYRQNTIIEVVQAIAKSRAGSQIAFKGGTALKLFYGTPRYSEDIDYDPLPGVLAQELMKILKDLFVKRRWEITDEAIKYFTILHIPHHSGHPFYSIPATDSIANWPPILLHSGHLS